MPIKNNYHTHTVLCGHASGTIKDYLKMAESLNYDTLGFSEHAPLPIKAFLKSDYDRLYILENMNMNTFYNIYLKELHEDKGHYNLNIEIGLESEFIESEKDFYLNLRKNVSYMILGVHFFKYNGKMIDTYKEINKETMYAYAKNIENALETGIFNILAHPDLYLYDNIAFDLDARNVANMIIESCIKHNCLIEINCNGKGKYPRKEFYELLKDKPVKVIIGVDAHDPKRLNGEHIEEVIALTKELGLNVVDKLEVQNEKL